VAKKKKVRNKKSRKRWALLVIPFLLLFAPAMWVDLSSRGSVTDKFASVDRTPVGIVFGAGVLPNRKPSYVLAERLDAAIELYNSGKVERLILSGDNRSADYNEPGAMRAYLLAHKIPTSALVMDFAGRDTYDTCYRAIHVFGCHSAILLTQGFHIDRAVFIARGLGMDAKGYAVPKKYDYTGQIGFYARESLADIKACWDVYVSHREPYVDQQKK